MATAEQQSWFLEVRRRLQSDLRSAIEYYARISNTSVAKVELAAGVFCKVAATASDEEWIRFCEDGTVPAAIPLTPPEQQLATKGLDGNTKSGNLAGILARLQHLI